MSHFNAILGDKKESEKKDENKSSLMEKAIFESRSIFIFGEINMELAHKISSQLVALSAVSKDPIKIYLNSPGGHVESGDTIHDMIKFVEAEVKIIGSGWVASAGALIFAAAKKENRICLPNTRFLLHQPSGGTSGQATDVEIQAKEIIKMKERLNKIFAKATGQKIEKVRKDTERDYWLSADEAVKYGLVGRIIENFKEI